MARVLPRLLVLSSALGVAHVTFVGCGGSDEVKHVMDEGGAAGEGGERSSSGGSSSGKAGAAPTAGTSTAGTANVEGGAGGVAGSSSSGAGGQPAPDTGGAAGSDNGVGGAGAGGMGTVGGAGAGGDDAGGAGGAGAEPCATLQTGRITIGFNANNAEWVNNLQWLDSANNLIANVAAYGGPGACNDPAEFFGQAYGAPEGTTPGIVVAGSRSTAVACGQDINITSDATNCLLAAQTPTHTEYHFYDGAKANQMRVTRTIGFSATSPDTTDQGLRVWQPRVGLPTWNDIIYPNAAGTGVTKDQALNHGGDYFIATGVNPTTGASWNGQWFADLTADGRAIIVRRDPTMTAPVSLTVNYDSYSYANLTSFITLKPQGDWKAPITEVQYLCFADLTSWPQTERDAAVLPTWCGP